MRERAHTQAHAATPPSPDAHIRAPLDFTVIFKTERKQLQRTPEEAGVKEREQRETEGTKKQNVKAGSFSMRCVTINSDTLNNSVSDIESAVCQQPCL